MPRADAQAEAKAATNAILPITPDRAGIRLLIFPLRLSVESEGWVEQEEAQGLVMHESFLIHAKIPAY